MIRCDWCGRFISYSDKNAKTYTNYGGYFDGEPPDATYVCGKCWLECATKKYYKTSEYIWKHAVKLFVVMK